jgi:hypothetical protein
MKTSTTLGVAFGVIVLAVAGKWSEGIQYGRITKLCTYN